MIYINNILRCFPIRIAKIIDEYIVSENINVNYLEEIRIRDGKPIILQIGNCEKIIDCIVSSVEILEILTHICDNSVYSYQNQICSRVYYNARG